MDSTVSPPLLYRISRLVVRLFAAILLRFTVKYKAPLPAGPKIFVVNHPSATDPFLIHLVSKEEINVMITEKAFQVKGFGRFLRALHEIPVPQPPKSGASALGQACEHLARGSSVAIFIEGHISPEEGGFLPPRTGAVRLALRAKVPVVPVGIYLRRDWRFHIRSGISGEQTEAFWYFHGPYLLTVGEPHYLTGDVEDRDHVRTLSEQLMEAIRSLSAESEKRGHRLMPDSLLMRLLRLLLPLRRKQIASGL